MLLSALTEAGSWAVPKDESVSEKRGFPPSFGFGEEAPFALLEVALLEGVRGEALFSGKTEVMLLSLRLARTMLCLA